MTISRQVAVDRDRELVERCRAGSTAAFDELFRSYKDRVYSLCLGVLGNQEDALDAVQECFTLVHRHIHRFDGRSRFTTWLYRIAINSSIQLLRRAKARPKTVPLNPGLVATPENEQTDAHDPRILDAMLRMAPDDRAILVLFYWQELSLPEIAQVVGCSQTAAKTRLFRARERFKKLYLAAGEGVRDEF